MDINRVLIYLFLSLFVSNCWMFRLCGISSIIVILLKDKLDKTKIKEMKLDVLYIIIVLVLNVMLNDNLSVLNFVYFNVINMLIYEFKKTVDKDKYLGLYFLLVLCIEVIKICSNL